MRRLAFAPLLVLVCTLAACGGGGGGGGDENQQNASGCNTVEVPTPAQRHEPKPTKLLDAKKTYEVTMQTNCGSFTIRLNLKLAPNTSASFVSLVRAGYFDHTIFHRIVPAFVIQGGDPSAIFGNPAAGGGPGYKTVDRPPANARYVHGTVAMAKAGAEAPGTSGSQFFIVTGAYAQLPPDYAILGKVVKGIDVVDKIGTLGHANESPAEVVEIEKATVTVT